jgi:hypothetical protein
MPESASSTSIPGTASTAGEYVRLPMLDSEGRNWTTWKKRFYLSVVARGHKSHLEDKAEVPKEGDSKFDGWEMIEAALMERMISTIPDSIYSQIQDKPTVKLMYDELITMFETKSLIFVMDLRRKLMTASCREGADLGAHFDDLKRVRESLGAAGQKIDEDDFVATLMGSLPPSYNGYLETMSGMLRITDATHKMTSSKLIQLVLEEQKRRAILAAKQSTNKTKDIALLANDRQDKKKIECFNCGKKGHRKADCWAKGGGKEGEGPKKGPQPTKKTTTTSAKVAAADDDDDDGVWMAYLEDEQDDLPNPEENDELDDEPETVAPHPSTPLDLYLCHDFDPFTYALGHDTRIETVKSEDGGEGCDDLPKASRIDGDDSSTTSSAPMESEVASTTTDADGSTVELYDSGCSRHMSAYRHLFTNFRTIDPKPIRAADRHVFNAIGKGNIQIAIPNDGVMTTVTLEDVLYCPRIGLTLISISKMTDAGFAVVFRGSECRIFDSSKALIGKIPASNGLYRVSSGSDVAYASFAKPQLSTILDLHRRLGHISPATIKGMLASRACDGLQLDVSSEMTSCASCEYAKTTRKPIQKTRIAPRAKEFGGEIHSDVWGPSPVQTIDKHSYYVSFTDDYTRWTTIYLMKTKSEVFTHYKSFEAWCKTQHGALIQIARTDRGGEYMSKAFDRHLAEKGTIRIAAPHDTPEYNGVSERFNRTGLERTRAFLHASGLPKFLWGEAISHVVWLKNRTTTRALTEGRTPYEMLYKTKPDLSGIFDWGAPIWVHDATGDKLGARGVLGRWVGLDRDGGSHRVYWPGKHSITVERSVRQASQEVLVPALQPLALEGEKPTSERKAEDTTDTKTEPEPETETPQDAPLAQTREPRIKRPTRYVKEVQAGTIHTHDMPSRRNRLPPGMSQFEANMAQIEHALVAATTEAEGFDPATLDEAKSRKDWPKWDVAIRKELDSLKTAKTWIIVRRPKDRNVVGSKWVLRLKKDSEGRIDKHKARVVAKGFTQIEGVDYYETFAPVARLASIRTVLAIAARNEWKIDTFDFHSAFLNGEFDENEEIYMEQPPGYEEKDRREYVLRLLKTIYGLKQSSRKWYEIICRLMTELGFTRSESDPAVFYWHEGDNRMAIVVHVDDCTIVGNSQELIDDIKRKINAKYAMTDLGPTSWVLGIKITRNLDNHTLGLSQTAYIDSILRRFNFTDLKPVSTPMDPTIRYSKTQCPETLEEKARMKNIPYREAVGALMYCAVATRPDISFAVALLSQFLENPGEVHWNGVKHIYKYLLGTKHLKLIFGETKNSITGYTDADGATQEHRHAISGYAFLIDGGAVSWFSRKQEIVTLSTAEAEYVAATHAAKEAIWLKRLITEIFNFPDDPITLHCDNQSAIALTKDNAHHSRTKHIDIRYHFIRYSVQDGKINIIYCPTNENIADTLTKPLPSIKAKHFAAALGLRAH